MRRCVLLTIVVALSSSVALASGRISSAVFEVIEDLKQQQLEAEQKRIDGLHGSYLSTGVAHDRKLTSLALGVHYLETNHRLATQYLSSAEMSCRANDVLLPIVRFFLAQAKFRAGAYTESVLILADLLEGQPADAWRKPIFGLLIENYFEAGDFDQLAMVFKEYSENFSFSRRQENLARLAVQAFEKRGDGARAIEVLEELARSYPTTEDSRWAFRRLVELTCEAGAGPRYDFSDKLLVAMSRNVVLDEGIRELLVNLVSGRVRLDNQPARVLSPDDRAELLFRLRLYDEAAQENLALYDDAVARGDLRGRAHFAFQLGRAYLRMHNSQKSAEWFSRFIAQNPKSSLVHKARELLGDSFKYLGMPKLAAEQFELSLALKNDKFVRWERFWNTYRAADYKGALAMLEEPGYIEPRPGDEEQSLTYWHGRILEKLGAKKEALEKFTEILGENGDAYYANLIAVQHPELIEPSALAAAERAAERRAKSESKGLSLAAKILPKAPHEGGSLPPSTAPTRPELKVVDDLLRVGLKDIATMQLSSLKWSDYNHEEAFAAVSRLAWVLDDYQPSRRIRSFGFSQLRNLPASFKDYLIHQASNGDDWKIYYPMAFEAIVHPIAKNAEVDPFLILSIMRSESFYNKEARSPVGAQGLMQLMPYTAVKIASILKDNSFDVNDLTRPEINIGYGGYYLGKLLHYYGGNPYVAAAAYNAGPVAVNHWLQGCDKCATEEFVETIPYRETRRYVREVMKTYAHYRRVYLSQAILSPLPPLPVSLPEGEEIF